MQLSRIIARVRANTGWSSTSEVSTARIKEAINYIYQRKIPHVLKWEGLQEWGYVDLVDGTGDYSFATQIKSSSGGTAYGDRVRSIIPPILIIVDSDNATYIGYTKDHDGFWKKYPPIANATEGQPLNLLDRKKYIYVRPVPDTSYTLKFLVNLRPAALSNDSDEPVEDWGEAIVAGSTALIMEDDEEEDVNYWWGLFADRLKVETLDHKAGAQPRVKQRW